MSRGRSALRWVGVIGVVVIAVAGGYTYERYLEGMGTAGAVWAPYLLISNPDGPGDA